MSLDISLTLCYYCLLSEKKDFTVLLRQGFELQIQHRSIRVLFQKILLILSFLPLIYLNKILPASIIGSFNGIWEKTRGKLISALMVTQAFTTDPFPAAGVTTITSNLVFLYLAFDHSYDSPTNFLNSFSSMMVNPSFLAFSYFEPGSAPTTT